MGTFLGEHVWMRAFLTEAKADELAECELRRKQLQMIETCVKIVLSWNQTSAESPAKAIQDSTGTSNHCIFVQHGHPRTWRCLYVVCIFSFPSSFNLVASYPRPVCPCGDPKHLRRCESQILWTLRTLRPAGVSGSSENPDPITCHMSKGAAGLPRAGVRYQSLC